MSFAPPPYPYERLDELKRRAAHHEGGPIDCSIGTPIDAPPDFVIEELARAAGVRGYPSSIGSPEYRAAASAWLTWRFGVSVASEQVAACVGTKEFVASVAGYWHLRYPERDTVLYPAVSYPTYAMGATLAGLRAVPVRVEAGRLDLASVRVDDAERALLIWSNSPSNPTGHLDDLAGVAAWARERGVLVISDECYSDFTWSGPARSVLQEGVTGVLALHSISKRSNLAGLRAGFYAGDPEAVAYLAQVRQHAGLMVPGPVQSAVALAYGDDAHVQAQRSRYHARLATLSEALRAAGVEAPMPEGGFYLWCRREGLDAWELARALAELSGLVVSPGELYGDAPEHVRLAVVQTDERLELAAARLRSRSI